MEKGKLNPFRYLYTILMLVTCLLLMPFLYGRIQEELPTQLQAKGLVAAILRIGSEETADTSADGISPDGISPEENVLEDSAPGDMEGTEAPAEDPQDQTPDPEPEPDDTDDVEENTEPREFTTVDRTYLENALFIGDSRTVGLYEYADLGGADVFASTGMNVYKVFDTELEVGHVGKTTLEYLLTEKSYGKIYVMLGINELGYVYEETLTAYKAILDKIHELQPDAIVFIEANLHVSKDKSDHDALYNNDNINRLNAGMQAFADSRTFFYIDVNELFDEDGCLGAEYTFDDIHVLAKYYDGWVDWICTKGIL